MVKHKQVHLATWRSVRKLLDERQTVDPDQIPSADSRRAVVSFWQKNVHNTG